MMIVVDDDDECWWCSKRFLFVCYRGCVKVRAVSLQKEYEMMVVVVMW
jgi:hypothetical protein